MHIRDIKLTGCCKFHMIQIVTNGSDPNNIAISNNILVLIVFTLIAEAYSYLVSNYYIIPE